MFKKEIRIIGIDDSPFKKFEKGKEVLVIGTFFRGGNFLDGIVSTKVELDGNNSTEKIAEMLNKSKFKPQLQAIMLDGIAVAGFNVIDIKKLSKKTNLPVIVIIRKLPDFKKIKQTLKKINLTEKYKLIEKAGQPCKVSNVYVQFTGISLEKLKEILKITCTHSLIPEPIRTAHIIASGIIDGESRGRA
jgi:hypothetical protein